MTPLNWLLTALLLVVTMTTASNALWKMHRADTLQSWKTEVVKVR